MAPANETIFALSSGRPPAAVAIVRTSGPHAFDAAEALTGPLPKPRVAALRTIRDPRTDEEIDQALILRFDAPASATGENIVEYQCHGGRAVIDRLLRVLAEFEHFRLAEPGEFTRRAFASGRIDLTEAEGLADLLEAETESQRKVALKMAEGGLRRRIEDWRDRLLDLSAQAEAAIDYVGDEDETATDARALHEGLARIGAEVETLLALPRSEPLREGIRVVVTGPPNAGKSSLINAISQSERAIVTDVAGTTRDTIEVPLAIHGIPFLFIDTAGLRESLDPVEKIGIDRARHEARLADITIWLGAPDAPEAEGAVLVRAKSDLQKGGGDTRLSVSSLTGEGLPELVGYLVEKAGNILPGPDQLSLNRRQAELLERLSNVVRGECEDIVIVAENARSALALIDELAGRTGVEDMLDRLFGRFCLGK